MTKKAINRMRKGSRKVNKYTNKKLNKVTKEKQIDDSEKENKESTEKNAESGYETGEQVEKLDSLAGCMKAALAADRFLKIRLLKKQEKRLGLRRMKKEVQPKIHSLVVMPYSNISNMFMKARKKKKTKPEKITLKSLKESMETFNSSEKRITKGKGHK